MDLLANANTDTCPVCGGAQGGTKVWDNEDFSIITCAQCLTMHLAPVPSTDAITQIYNNNYYQDDDEVHGYSDYAANEAYIKKTYRARLLKVIGRIDPDYQCKRVHEIGSALGYGLDVARELLPDATITGSDISQDGIETCREKGYECYTSDVIGRSKIDGKVDLLYLFDVIEHLTDLNGFFDWTEEIVVPGGYIAFTTPDMGSILNRILGARSPSIKIPQHIIYFTTSSLQKLMSDKYTHQGHFIDFQHLSFGHLLSRATHAVGLPAWSGWDRVNVPVVAPTGMKLYVFRKR